MGNVFCRQSAESLITDYPALSLEGDSRHSSFQFVQKTFVNREISVTNMVGSKSTDN
jgi:hypothetical protein